MSFNPFSKFIALMRKKEHFLVLELFRDNMRALSLSADAEGRMLYVGAPVVARAGETFGAFIKRLGNIKKSAVLVSCDAALAVTTHRTVTLAQDGVIDEAGSEHIVAQAVWKLFDGERGGAAKRLGVPCEELTICDARVWRVALDGKTVADPAGFSAKRVEVTLAVTMMPKSLVEELLAALPAPPTLISVSGVSWARVLGAGLPDEHPFLVAGLFPEHAALTFAHGDIRTVDAFSWGEKDFVSGVAAQLAVTDDIARYIIGVVQRANATSPLFAQKVGGIIAGELQLLVNGIQAAISGLPARAVYAVTAYHTPPSLFQMTVKNSSRRLVKIIPVSADDVSKNFGVAIQWKVEGHKIPLAGAVITFFDAYIAPRMDKLNAIARRRVRWMSSHSFKL